ncbi:MAG: hypothetical protein ACI85Q_000120 [Salibacteraceae bacterium]|jgi:hypothetical protein
MLEWSRIKSLKNGAIPTSNTKSPITRQKSGAKKIASERDNTKDLRLVKKGKSKALFYEYI